MAGFGHFNSDSRASQENTNITDGGQQIRGKKSSFVINQGGSTLLDFSGIQTRGGDFSLQTGLDGEGVNNLLGAFKDTNAQNLSALENASNKIAGLVSETNDAISGNPKLFAGIAFAAIAAAAAIVFLAKK